MKMWLIVRKRMNVFQPLLLLGCPIKCPNISTTPLRQWGFRQCLPFRWTTLKANVSHKNPVLCHVLRQFSIVLL